MRLLAATLIPLFLLGLFEAGLRLVGYGHSTRFFLPATIGEQDFLIPNRQFTYSFFPPAIARMPLPLRVPEEKPDDTFRIFLFGESAAYGDPDPSFGMGRYLEALLETRYPFTDFEVVCVAITAINSHVILPIARDCARQEADLWIVYMGNNEMVGPYGAGTVFGGNAPSQEIVKGLLFLKSTRIGQLLGQLITRVRGQSDIPQSWEGIEMFSENLLGHDNPKRLKAYENFSKNLDDILSVGRAAGVPVVLSTVATNLKDCSPFASLHSIQPGAELQDWERWFQEGIELEEAEAFESALQAYAKAAAIDPQYAELYYRIGISHLALGDTVQAAKAFARARDHDALAVRADTRINAIIRNAIRDHAGRGVMGVDAAADLRAIDAEGLPGYALFYEHVHFTLDGNYHMARLLADAVEAQLPGSVTSDRKFGDPVSERRACQLWLAETLWDRKRVWNVALERISTRPFTEQSSHESAVAYFKSRMDAVDSQTTQASPSQVRLMYTDALLRDPDDSFVRWNYAQYLERSDNIPEAINQGIEICRRLPHAPWPHFFTGSLMAREGRAAEAVDYLQQALEIQDSLDFARQELESLRVSHPHLFR